MKYETNAAFAHNTDFPGCNDNTSLKCVADNPCTLDGKNSFHGMGIIATTTPGSKLVEQILRKGISEEQIKQRARIEICYYQVQNHVLENIRFGSLFHYTYTIEELFRYNIPPVLVL